MESKDLNRIKNNGDSARKKVLGIYDKMTSSFFFINPTDNDILDGDNKYNSNLLLTLLTGVVKGKQIIYGNPGTGKTTSVEIASSMLYSLPLDSVISYGEIHGQPEITSEDLFGTLELPEMRKMKWSPFVQIPYARIVDEINRLYGKQQDMLLNLVDRGVAKYLSNTLIAKESSFYATANWPDSGNTELIRPFLDRFDVSTETKQLSPLERLLLMNKGEDNTNILTDPETTKTINKVMFSDEDYRDKVNELAEISKSFRSKLEDRLGIKLLTLEELNDTRNYIENIEFSADAKLFALYLHSELALPNFRERTPQYSHLDESDHYANTNYAFNKIETDVSNRFTTSLFKYARAYAWLAGDEEVTAKHLQVMLPYVINHRVKFSEGFSSKLNGGTASNLDLAKELTDNLSQQYNNNNDMYSNLYNAFAISIANKDKKQFDKIAERYGNDDPFIAFLRHELNG